LTWIDWLVLSVYLIGVTFLGVMAYRKVKDMDDFFMGGRRFGKVLMMFFAFGAGTSSEQATAVVAASGPGSFGATSTGHHGWGSDE